MKAGLIDSLSSRGDRVPLRKMVDFLGRRFAIVVFLGYIFLHGFYHRVPVDSSSPFWRGENYNIAVSIVQGKGFAHPFPGLETGPSAYVAPPFPYLLAGVLWLVGTKTPAAGWLTFFLQCLLFAGTMWLLYTIVKSIFSTTAARLATLIWLISPNRIGFTSTFFLSEVGLSTFGILLVILTLIRFNDRSTRKAAALAGIAIGFAILSLPVMVLALPFFSYALYEIARRQTDHPLVKPLIALTLCMAILTPWTIRNYAVMQRFVFIKSNFGVVLFLGNHDDSDKVLLSPAYGSYAERHLIQTMGEIAYTQYSLQRAKEWIRSHRKEFLVRCVKRSLAFWVANPAIGLKRWIWSVYQIPLLLSSALGLWRHWRRSPITNFCFAILITVPSVYYITALAEAHRYRLPLEALLTIFASAVLIPSLPRNREPGPAVLASI